MAGLVHLLVSLPLLAGLGLAAMPSSMAPQGTASYTVIYSDYYDDGSWSGPGSKIIGDDCTEETQGSDDTYWMGSQETVRGDSDAIVLKIEPEPANEIYIPGAIVFRNAQCGPYNECGVKDFQVQVPHASFVDTDVEALENSWRTILSGTLPDPRSTNCTLTSRPYQQFFFNDGVDHWDGYVRIVANSWWGSYPALEFVAFTIGVIEEEDDEYGRRR